MDKITSDLLYGVRMLRKTPTATATVLIALALGIGFSALTFSLIDGAVLTRLPVEAGDRIMRIERAGDVTTSAEDLAFWSARQRSFDHLGAVTMGTVILAVDGFSAEPVRSAAITPSVLPLLSTEPVIGRSFTEGDALPGAEAVVLVSHHVWSDRFGGASDVLGAIIRVNGRPSRVVGVMPEGFGFPWRQRVWTVLDVDPLHTGERTFNATANNGSVVGRLREGVSPVAAAAELTRLTSELDAAESTSAASTPLINVSGYTDLFSRPGASAALAALMLGIAFLVLLVACANVANVLLARAVARRREIAIRLALGASRGRVAAQLLAEISLLGFAGAAGGLVIALMGTRLVQPLLSEAGTPYWIDIRVDPGVIAFAAGAAILAALMAGLAPVLQVAGANTHELLKDDARGSSSFRLGRIMRRLIGVEIAVSFILLVHAGLFIRSALNFSQTEFTFQPQQVYTGRISLPETVVSDPAARARFADQLLAMISDLPQVADAALSTAVPGVGSAPATRFQREVAAAADEGGGEPRARSIIVTPGYFGLFRTSVMAGRNFDSRDQLGSLPVAAVNEAFARRYFPEGALDRRIRYVDERGAGEWLTIVGVTPDLLAGGVEGQLEEAIYLPMAQNPSPTLRVLARPWSDFASVADPIRQSVADLDPDAALFAVLPLDVVIARANSQYTWFSLVFLISGGIAMFLAAIGLYGVMAFWVIQRTREIGVRMAIGGQRWDIVRLVLGQGLKQTSFGLVAGLLLALPAARLLSSAFFGVAPYDPLVFGSIIGVLGGSAALGCWVPALRATRIDPLEALVAE